MPEVMKFELASKEGVILQTAGKYCTHDIMVEPVVEDLTVTENGTYPVPEGHTGHGDLTVDVQPNLTAVMLTENGTYAAPDDADGYSEVTVDVQPKLANVTIRDNGTHPVPEGYDGFGEITVDVDAFPYQDIEITYSLSEQFAYHNDYTDMDEYNSIVLQGSDVGYEIEVGKTLYVINGDPISSSDNNFCKYDTNLRWVDNVLVPDGDPTIAFRYISVSGKNSSKGLHAFGVCQLRDERATGGPMNNIEFLCRVLVNITD